MKEPCFDSNLNQKEIAISLTMSLSTGSICFKSSALFKEGFLTMTRNSDWQAKYSVLLWGMKHYLFGKAKLRNGCTWPLPPDDSSVSWSHLSTSLSWSPPISVCRAPTRRWHCTWCLTEYKEDKERTTYKVNCWNCAFEYET